MNAANVRKAIDSPTSVRRHVAFSAYRIAQRLVTTDPFGDEGDVGSVLFYPAITSAEQRDDLLNQLGWYFPDGAFEGEELFVTVEDGVDATTRNVPEHHERYDIDHLPLQFVDPSEAESCADHVDRILVWRDADPTLASTELLRNLDRVRIVDPEFYLITGQEAWREVGSKLRADRDDRSRKLYRDLERKVADYDTAYVFATGPSLDEAFEMDVPDDAVKIGCNSIVRHDEILDHVDLDVLTFFDPNWHFGPTEFSGQFRRDVVDVLDEYDCVAAVPRAVASLLTAHHPSIEDRVVGIEHNFARKSHRAASRAGVFPHLGVNRTMKRFKFPTSSDLEVMRTNNIMTDMMLPIASSLADRVFVVGADGRAEDDSDFWEHNEDVKYESEMRQAVVDANPSQFRDIVYPNYYRTHVNIIGNLVNYGECRGVEYYSLTESHIPCLSRREAKRAR